MRSVALIVPLLLACSAPVLAQDAPLNAPVPDSQPFHRSPATARLLGTLIPGAGHVYAGEYAKGVRYYYGTLSGIGGGALTYAVSGMAPNRALSVAPPGDRRSPGRLWSRRLGLQFTRRAASCSASECEAQSIYAAFVSDASIGVERDATC